MEIMRILNKHSFCVRLALFLASLLFVSCSPANTDKDTAIRQEQEAAGAAFSSVYDTFFQEEMRKSSFHMHFYLSKERRNQIGPASSIFTPVSLAHIQEDIAKAKEYQNQLSGIDYFALDSDDRLLYDILSEHMKTRCMLEGIELYYEPLTPDTGIQSLLPILLGEYEFKEAEDIESYLTALEHMDTYFEEILAFEKEKAAFGSFMSDSAYQLVLNNLDAYILSPNNHALIQSFNDRISALKDSLSPEVYEAYIQKNQEYVTKDFHNAYTLLHTGLQEIKSGPMGIDTGKEENQSKYLTYLLQAKTYTSLTDTDDIREEIKHDINSDIKALAEVLAKENTADIQNPIPTTVADYTSLIKEIQAGAADIFPMPEELSYEVKLLPDTLGASLPEAFYFSPSLEQSNNTVYINAYKMQHKKSDAIQSLLVHEAIPGHMLQWNHFIQKDYPLLRKHLTNPAFSEGWAIYCETILPSLYGKSDTSTLQFVAYQNKINIGLYAYIDLSIHFYGDTKEDIEEFLHAHAGIQDADIIHTLYEAIEANPTRYLTYYLGYREIIRMKQQAKEILKDRYSDYDFHTWLLDMGPAPFNIIKKYFNIYLNLSK